jgi:hypothetical protein
MNKASMHYLHRRNHKPFKARKNQNKLLLEDNALIFSLQNEHLSTSSNFTWLHVDLQRVKVRSIALIVAFPEQMCQVASTGLLEAFSHSLLLLTNTQRCGILESEKRDVSDTRRAK